MRSQKNMQNNIANNKFLYFPLFKVVKNVLGQPQKVKYTNKE